MGKVKFMIEEATSRRGCLVELPWSAGEAFFVLTCQWEKSVEEPVWTLYEQENGVTSKVVWTQSFAPGDLEFMYDILVMSAPKNTSLGNFTAIPDLLKPEVDTSAEDNSWSGGASLQQPDPISNFPAMAPLPSPGMMPGAMGTGLPSALPGMPGMPGGPPQSSYQNMPPQPQMPAPHQQGSSFSNMPMQPHPGHPNQNISGQNQQYNANNYPPPQGYPQPQQGYGGYPPQQPMQQQYPYQQQMPQQMPPQQMPPQQMQPMQPAYQQQPAYPPQGYQSPPAQLPPEPKINIDYHLLDKRPNVLLGSMLKNAGLISEPTLEAALKLQDLIRDERMSPERAPHVLKRLHAMGGNIDQYLTPEDTSLEPPSLLDAPAKPKKPEPAKPPQAAGASGGPGAGAGAGAPAGAKRNLKPAFDLLQTAGILSAEDIKVALEVRKSHGGDLVGILEAASKVSRKTVDAAFVCLPLIREGLLKVEQCIIALNYCSRMRVGFDDALDEMGWQNPRKMRTDLNL